MEQRKVSMIEVLMKVVVRLQRNKGLRPSLSSLSLYSLSQSTIEKWLIELRQKSHVFKKMMNRFMLWRECKDEGELIEAWESLDDPLSIGEKLLFMKMVQEHCDPTIAREIEENKGYFSESCLIHNQHQIQAPQTYRRVIYRHD